MVRGTLRPSDYTIMSSSGSICCNDLQHLGEGFSPEELALYRGACIREGFQSIAIVPIFQRGAILGIIHIADPRPDLLSANTLQCAEILAPMLGEVLARDQLERSLQSTQTNQLILSSIVSGISHLAYVTNLTTWEVLHLRPDLDAQLGFQQKTNRKCYQLFLLAFNDALRKNVQELESLSASLEEEIAERQDAQARLETKNKEIRYIAYHDCLTQLPNRANFYVRLAEELQGQSCGAVVFVDLDDLKMVNDAFGHTYGDALIQTAGTCIASAVGPQAFIARLGGDEFTVLLPDIHEEKQLSTVAETILTKLSQPVDVFGTRFHFSGSMGIALYPEHGSQVDELLKNADNAMYAAKKAGKNCWRVYDSEMGQAAYESVVLNNQLRQAFENNELMLYYQPQVSMSTGEIVGFEALLRWSHPARGFISPSQFIPMAEQNGLIHTLGKWVLEESCDFMRKLNGRGKSNLRIAVNVSPYQLCGDNFVNMVQQVLQNQGVLPQQLELEITESALISSMEESIEKLNRLKATGISISLDDFGTGFSSLTHLQRLPVQILKLDRSFIDSLLKDAAHRSLIACIIEMAHVLGMQVVAEGVETLEQRNCLREYGCDFMQGYLISPPVPLQEAQKML